MRTIKIVTLKMLEYRIKSLVNQGKEICKEYTPDKSSSFNSITCSNCGYSSDTHLLRDIWEDLK